MRDHNYLYRPTLSGTNVSETSTIAGNSLFFQTFRGICRSHSFTCFSAINMFKHTKLLIGLSFLTKSSIQQTRDCSNDSMDLFLTGSCNGN